MHFQQKKSKGAHENVPKNVEMLSETLNRGLYH